MIVTEQSTTTGGVNKQEQLSAGSTAQYGYHEISGLKSGQYDVIEQLNSNIMHLEDLHGRLRFMLSELQSIVRQK